MKTNNKRKKYKFNRMKYNIFIFLVFVLFLGIGYSVLGTNLSILGSVMVARYKEPIIKTTTYSDKTAFRSDTYRSKIKTITLNNKIDPPANVIASWDIGEAQNGNVMAYIMFDH